ncbi:MAG: flagellar hook-length control protein FliK [Betaproteobacteria bacterium]
MITVQPQHAALPATAAAPGAADEGEVAMAAGTDFAVIVSGLLAAASDAAPLPAAEADPAGAAASAGDATPEAGGQPAASVQDAAAAIERAIAAGGAAVLAAPYAADSRAEHLPLAGSSSDGAGARPDPGTTLASAVTARAGGGALRGVPATEEQGAPPATNRPEPGAGMPRTEAWTLPGLNTPDLQQSPQQALGSMQPMPRAMAPASAAEQSPLRIDAPIGTARWHDDLASRVTMLVRGAVSEAEIQVTPAELGPVQARISIDAGIASIVLNAPSPEARAALEGALAGLRERLAENGLALGEASVSGEPASQFASRDGGTPRQDAGKTPSAGAVPAGDGARAWRREGLIDLYA